VFADPEARQIFDGLYAFSRDHPSAGSPDLMAWKQVGGCKNVDLRNTGSATDGDMDIATDYLLAGDARALAALRPINAWLRDATGGDPGKVVGGYKLDGTPMVGYYEPAFAAPFGVGAMAGAENQDWLNAVWDRLTDGSSDGYYSDTLRMQALMSCPATGGRRVGERVMG
jgi:hypothetical protein